MIHHLFMPFRSFYAAFYSFDSLLDYNFTLTKNNNYEKITNPTFYI
jgi:hypothetical protein